MGKGIFALSKDPRQELLRAHCEYCELTATEGGISEVIGNLALEDQVQRDSDLIGTKCHESPI